MFSSMKMEEHMKSEICSIFLGYTGCQKCSTWVPWGPTLSILCSIMSVFEETYKCPEPESSTCESDSVFLVK